MSGSYKWAAITFHQVAPPVWPNLADHTCGIPLSSVRILQVYLVANGEGGQLSLSSVIGRKVLGVCPVARSAGFFEVDLFESRGGLGKSNVLWPAEHLLRRRKAGRARDISPFIEKSLWIFSCFCSFCQHELTDLDPRFGEPVAAGVVGGGEFVPDAVFGAKGRELAAELGSTVRADVPGPA